MKELFVALFIVVIVGFILSFAATIKFSSIGHGSHTGYITAVDQNGYIYKNYDVYFKTDTSSSQEDLYCIQARDKELVDEAIKYSKSKQLVTIEYRGVRGIGFHLCHATRIEAVSL